MSADREGDSHMLSSPDDSENDVNNNDAAASAATPVDQTLSTSLSSPPDSQQRHSSRSMSTSVAGSSVANQNGKRPLQTISNGDDADELAAMANGKARQDQPVKTHAASGYQWSKAEDEPGYLWMNKKAVDEATRAYEGLQHKDAVVQNRYGDPFEVAEKEQAILASLQQR